MTGMTICTSENDCISVRTGFINVINNLPQGTYTFDGEKFNKNN